MNSEVMSFARSDSHEDGVTRGNELAKGVGLSPFSEYFRFYSYALECSNVQQDDRRYRECQEAGQMV